MEERKADIGSIEALKNNLEDKERKERIIS